MNIADWLDIGEMDDLGRLNTPVHRLDARAKTIVTLAFIAMVMSFPRYELSALTPFLLYPLTVMAIGRIPPHPIVTKVLLAAPFALLVGIFNPLLDHHPVATLGPWTVTGGWMSFASILLRFMLTVGAALTLVACTGMVRLGAGLEQLGCPRVFVVQLLFLHRYLFVVAAEGATMRRSVELRSAGRGSPPLSVYGPLVGHLLLRCLDRADRIHRAMAARGFDGRLRPTRPSAFRWIDALFVIGWIAFFAAARTWNLAEALGRLLIPS
jgi:cobalt/nickel transport system permease protein